MFDVHVDAADAEADENNFKFNLIKQGLQNVQTYLMRETAGVREKQQEVL